jgi:hypothetical protein
MNLLMSEDTDEIQFVGCQFDIDSKDEYMQNKYITGCWLVKLLISLTNHKVLKMMEVWFVRALVFFYPKYITMSLI